MVLLQDCYRGFFIRAEAEQAFQSKASCLQIKNAMFAPIDFGFQTYRIDSRSKKSSFWVPGECVYMDKLLFSILWTTGTILISFLGWVLISTLLHRLYKPKKTDDRETGLGLIDPDAEARRQIDWAGTGVRIALGCLVATPVFFVLSVGILAMAYPESGSAAWVLLIAAVLMTGYALIRYKTALGHRREIQWYHEARAMVDRAVAPLVPRGYVVFRDFRDDELRIDHLLVGPKGVFALQTLVWPEHHKEGRSPHATVTYDGRALYFPQGEDHLIADHAQRQAEKISDWITKRLGMPIAARAMIALPGWQVKRTSSIGISVINPGQMEALFQYIQPWPLSEDLLLQIARLVENHHGTIRNIPIESVVGEGLTP
jgi:hypothetical protein